MNEQERFVKLVAQAVAEWWASLGGFAWVVLGLLLLAAVAILALLLRWLWAGIASRKSAASRSDTGPANTDSA